MWRNDTSKWTKNCLYVIHRNEEENIDLPGFKQAQVIAVQAFNVPVSIGGQDDDSFQMEKSGLNKTVY